MTKGSGTGRDFLYRKSFRQNLLRESLDKPNLAGLLAYLFKTVFPSYKMQKSDFLWLEFLIRLWRKKDFTVAASAHDSLLIPECLFRKPRQAMLKNYDKSRDEFQEQRMKF